MSNIGDLMRNVRLADPDCGTSALARSLGITKAYLLLIEQGRRIPSDDLIIRWAQAVGKPWLAQQLLLWAIDARGCLTLRFRQDDLYERRQLGLLLAEQWDRLTDEQCQGIIDIITRAKSKESKP